MNEFWILILMAFFATISLDKVESVQLEELPLQTFDEICGGWLDKAEAGDLKTPPNNFGQNVHPQIGRQNTQLGQEPNSTDQNPPPLTESDHSELIEPNSTDQNPPIPESDHSDNAKNGEEQNEIMKVITSSENERKQIIGKFHAMKDEFKQKGKYSTKEWNQIEDKIAKHLKVGRQKIYKWKKELGISQKMHNYGKKKKEYKHLLEKFDQMKAELKRDGFKNSYHHEIDKTVAKELGLNFRTIYKWKRELGQTAPNKYLNSEQKELIKRYYEIKEQNPKFNDDKIAKMLKIGTRTLYNWKKQFKRPQLHQNSVDGHFVEKNSAANVQEIENSNSGE